VPKADLDRFFAKIHTPIQPTAELEQKALAEAAARPEVFEPRKGWPGSNWEIMKPGWRDVLGSAGAVLVRVMLLLLWLIVSIR
jgi:SSS family solute:Na+ symporter